MRPPGRERLIAITGVLVGAAMVVMKVIPRVPGAFSVSEWLALSIWVTIGLVLGWRSHHVRPVTV
jgi:hypothetical protein